MLERYFRTKLTEEFKFIRIGGYWDKKGETEIALIVVNELEKYDHLIICIPLPIRPDIRINTGTPGGKSYLLMNLPYFPGTKYRNTSAGEFISKNSINTPYFITSSYKFNPDIVT